MTASNIVSQLKELLKLEEERESLQANLEKLGSRIDTIKSRLLGDTDTKSEKAAKPAAKSKKPKTTRKRRQQKAAPTPAAPAQKAEKAPAGKKKSGTPRGALMAGILRELEAAGSKGSTVKELSEKLKVDYKNIYIWFVTTGKKNPKIKRVGPARFKLAA